MSILFFPPFWNQIMLAGWELRIDVIGCDCPFPVCLLYLIKWTYNKASLLLECLRIAYLEKNGKSSILLVFPHLDGKCPSLPSSSRDGLSGVCIIAHMCPASLKFLNMGWFSLCLQWQSFIWLYLFHDLQNLKVHALWFCLFTLSFLF